MPQPNVAIAGDVTRAYDALLKTTLDNYRGQLVDNFFKQNVLSYVLKEKGKVRMINGGQQIVEHLLTGENDDVGSYAEWQPVDITPQGGIDVAKFDWGSLVGTIAISGLEEAAVVLRRAGEGALLVAEQLGLDELARDRRAVHLDERTGRAR